MTAATTTTATVQPSSPDPNPGPAAVRPPALPTLPAQSPAHTPAGFWLRACAHLIDSTLLSMIVTPLLIGIYWRDFVEQIRLAAQNPLLAGAAGESSMAILHGPAGIIIQYVIPSIAVILLWRWRSATPGKMLLKLKIVDAETEGKPSTGQLLIRFFGYLASMLPLCLGFFAIGWDKRKQGWHDKLARTVVVQEN